MSSEEFELVPPEENGPHIAMNHHVCKLKWNVYNFSSISLDKEHFSPTASPPDLPDCKWCIGLSVNESEGEKFISLFLKLDFAQRNRVCIFQYTLAVGYSNNEIISEFNIACDVTSERVPYCTTHRLRFADVTSDLHDDTLMAEAEVALFPPQSDSVRCDAMYCLQAGNGLSADLSVIFESQAFCDVVICVENARKPVTIPAHRAVLASRSPIFRDMLSKIMMEYKLNGAKDKCKVTKEKLEEANDKLEEAECKFKEAVCIFQQAECKFKRAEYKLKRAEYKLKKSKVEDKLKEPEDIFKEAEVKFQDAGEIFIQAGEIVTEAGGLFSEAGKIFNEVGEIFNGGENYNEAHKIFKEAYEKFQKAYEHFQEAYEKLAEACEKFQKAYIKFEQVYGKLKLSYKRVEGRANISLSIFEVLHLSVKKFDHQSSYVFRIACRKYVGARNIFRTADKTFGEAYKNVNVTGENDDYPCIRISNIDPDTVRHMLFYIYTGKFDDKRGIDEVIELLKCSERYSLLDLKKLCEVHLIRAIQEENAIKCFFAADQYNAKKLKTKSLNIICGTKRSIARMHEFLNSSEGDQKQKLRVLAEINIQVMMKHLPN